MKAWHFLRSDLTLGYDDGRKVAVGTKLTVDGSPILCEHGLHASIKAIDALGFAPGPVACLVEVGGEILEDDDKIVGTERTVIAMDNAEEALRHFARLCSLDVVESWECPKVVREWLETGDKDLRSAARSAAWSATESAAESAARSAARSAAWSATESAAWSAAEPAARSATWSATESAAWSAAWSAARSAAWSAAESAAWSAAWSAAESAAWSAQNDRLTSMLSELLGINEVTQ